jgi:hypothetical protein
MSNVRLSTPLLTVCVLALFMVVSPAGLAQSPDGGPSALAPQLPSLGPWVDIWVNDPIDNTTPAVAYSTHHDQYLVVWQNERLSMTDIYARRVGTDGTLKSWFSVQSAPAPAWYQHPVVAYTPLQDVYLVVYEYNGLSPSTTDILGRFIRWDGGYMASEFAIAQGVDSQMSPAIAYNSRDDEFLVVYENWWAGGLRDIAAQRIKAGNGALLSWRNIATGSGQWRYAPSVAYNATRNEYLITYSYSHNATLGNGDIYGKVASANLGTLSSEMPIVADGYDQQNSAVAAAKDEYLVVWEDGTSGTNDYDIYARRISGGGTLLGSAGGFAIAAATANRRETPDVAFGSGCGYLVSWSYREGGSPGWPPTLQDVYGAYVWPGQDSIYVGQFAIDDGSWLQAEPAVACGRAGACFVAEEDNWPGTQGYEVRGRSVTANFSDHLYLPTVLRGA